MVAALLLGCVLFHASYCVLLRKFVALSVAMTVHSVLLVMLICCLAKVTLRQGLPMLHKPS